MLSDLARRSEVAFTYVCNEMEGATKPALVDAIVGGATRDVLDDLWKWKIMHLPDVNIPAFMARYTTLNTEKGEDIWNSLGLDSGEVVLRTDDMTEFRVDDLRVLLTTSRFFQGIVSFSGAERVGLLGEGALHVETLSGEELQYLLDVINRVKVVRRYELRTLLVVLLHTLVYFDYTICELIIFHIKEQTEVVDAAAAMLMLLTTGDIIMALPENWRTRVLKLIPHMSAANKIEKIWLSASIARLASSRRGTSFAG